MSTVTSRAGKNTLDGLIKVVVDLKEIGPSISQAAQDLLTAVEYKDAALRSSAMSALTIALRDVIQECVDAAFGGSERIKKAIDEFQLTLRGQCFTGREMNELGTEIVNRLNHVQRRWTDAQNSAFKLRKMGLDVSDLEKIQFEIDSLQAIKEKFSNDWLRTQSWKPPLDREMVARSRAAFERGECKSIGDLLAQ